MKKVNIYNLIIAFILLTGCKEIYLPETEFLEDVLVVNGLITDQPKRHLIQLSLTAKEGYKPLYGATVFTKDEEDNITLFDESGWGSTAGGTYYSPEFFAAEYGKTYTLHIITTEGKEYESKPQAMLPPINIDSLYGEKGSRDFLYPTSSGGVIKQSTEGLFVFGDFSNPTDDMPKLRLNVTLLLPYNYQISDGSDMMFYCWKKLNMVNILNINTPKFEIGSNGIRRHNVCFLPEKKINYGLAENEYFRRFILILRQYRLNDDAYEFYKGIKEQLSADGKLFDPIAAQLKGNIKCITRPEELALGFFEVSSTVSETYRLNSFISPYTSHYSFTKIPDLENVSNSDCLIDIPPYFWNY